ncbi:helix-turn-helix domain-containing protein [Microbaculum marinum]|uniref:Helix-turn-helix domain-containing protein n=1 Tax=Microbaculum marinum TaxID=1764581 RepID=A0AAW9RQM8_9HYPH
MTARIAAASDGAQDTGMSGKSPPEKIPPRERILAAARELFYTQGIRAVGVEAIAEAAQTNKMTLYRHFSSKDELVAEYLRSFASEEEAVWGCIAATHPGDPLAQLKTWIHRMAKDVADPDSRGCALANAAVQLPEAGHPARCVIENNKRTHRAHVLALCREAGLRDPDLVADGIFLMLEGARVNIQSEGHGGPACRFVALSEDLIASHSR